MTLRIYAYTNVNKHTYGCSITCRKENKKGETNDEEEGNAGKEDNVRKDIELIVFLVSILQWIFYLSFSFLWWISARNTYQIMK